MEYINIRQRGEHLQRSLFCRGLEISDDDDECLYKFKIIYINPATRLQIIINVHLAESLQKSTSFHYLTLLKIFLYK